MPDLRQINAEIIDPALAFLPAKFDSVRARVMLLAIGLQESRFEHRFQVVQGRPRAKGPARGFWQFERGGGVRGVLRHPDSKDHARRICRLRRIASEAPGAEQAVWITLERDDLLACCFARLLLWTDVQPLPELGDADEAWDYYVRTWRPGKPHPETWPELYARALATFEVTS